MKKRLYVLIMVCIVFCSTVLSSDQVVFDRANQLFVQGQWSEALSTYRSIQHKNSVIWQNIGNCYFNLQQYSHALVYWNRAYHGASFKQLKNLIACEKRVYEKLHIKVPSNFYFFLKRHVLFIPLVVIQLLCILLLLASLWVLIRCWRWQEIIACDRSILKWLLIGISITSCLWYLQTSFLDKRRAIVVDCNGNAYAGPDTTFHVVENITNGSLVKVLQKNNGMYKITVSSGYGWVPLSTIELINNNE